MATLALRQQLFLASANNTCPINSAAEVGAKAAATTSSSSFLSTAGSTVVSI